MACSLKFGSYFSGFKETMLGSNSNRGSWFCASLSSLDSKDSTSKKFPLFSIDFLGKPLLVPDQKGSINWSSNHPGNRFSVQAETTCVSRGMRWWEKNLRPNMVKIHSAEELVDSLQNAGDRLVIIDFYSLGCGGCKALHPKICQLAEQNPNAIFLEVNCEELNNMCQCLNIRVLPFFRFYRGAEGRLCSFSCTNSTIKKFKDALAKHGADRCSLGPAKGLDESELMKLVSAGELSTNLQSPSTKEEKMEDLLTRRMELSGILNKADSNKMELETEPALQ
ncbi:thioredoxin-like 1-2, chloroplastic [Durio zibethinus]|uniref:Thioredoxin-like 1-2, chloroplastic n=1 Tax=Durio zibethinus TaxID=66656 RepID=A0A6P5Y735_DURZI|nr:thioredoxin-like 1-2, chloroplastic [Durio zibethinus]